MKIKSRMAIIIVFAAIIIFLSIFLLTNTILKSAFNQIEKDLALNTAEMLKYDINGEMDRMASPVKDWAKWDETYNFAINRNEKYIKDNLGDNSIKNLKINAVIFSSDKDKIYYSKFYDYQKEEPLNVTENAARDINKYIVEIRDVRPLKGLVLIDDSLVLFASENITDSNEYRTTNDSLIFAKYLYIEDFNRVSTRVNKNISVEITPLTVSKEYPKAVRLDTDIYMFDESNNKLICLLQLYDILGEPIGIAHLEIDRGVYLQYQQTITNYLISFIVIIMLIGVCFFLIVKASVVDKINLVNDNINKMVSEGSIDNRIYVEADTEIMELTNSFNKLVMLLEERKKQLLEKNSELEKANTDLKKLDTLKDNFLSNISHEIRTPLTSLKSYTQLLSSGAFGKLNKKQDENVKILLDSISQLEHLVTDLLDVSRFESGRMPMHFEKNDVNKLIRETVKEFDPLIQKLDGKVLFKLDEKHKNITVDKDRIKQIIRNIVSNAVKYHGERPLKLIISSHLEEKNIIVCIEDNGIGIAKVDMKHLFEKFYQVDQGMKRKIGGSGLGLVIIKQIARAHQGNVHIESEPGKGTRVYVQLPYR